MSAATATTKTSMALLLRTLSKARIFRSHSPSTSSRTLISWARCNNSLLPTPRSRDIAASRRSYAAIASANSPFRSNLLRIIRNEIEYQSEYAPPHQWIDEGDKDKKLMFCFVQYPSKMGRDPFLSDCCFDLKIMQPATEFKSFSVEDRPGEQCIVMKGKFGEDESIKMEATMFDGFMTVPRTGLDASGSDVRLHVSLLVDISKADGSQDMEFLCSVWPNRIEIQNLYMVGRDKITGQPPYMGPKFGSLKYDFQTAIKEFLRVRGIDSELCFFLHEYMMNKDRIELIHWLRKLNSFIAK
ncbi:hypothetical protein Bca101_015378 [Brassica carinata]